MIAGDIASGTKAIDLFDGWPVPVIYVFGNHELYGHDFDEVVDQLRDAASGTSVHFLERDRVDIAGVRLLGCCLWTDYEPAVAPKRSRDFAMITAAHAIHGSHGDPASGRALHPGPGAARAPSGP